MRPRPWPRSATPLSRRMGRAVLFSFPVFGAKRTRRFHNALSPGRSIHVFIPASAVPSPSRSRIVFPAGVSAPSTSRGGRVFPFTAAVPQVLLSRIIPSQYRPPLYIARHAPSFTFPLRRFQGFSFKSGRLRPYCAGRGASQFAVATVGPSSSNHFLIRTGCALNIARHTPPCTFPLRRFRGFLSKSGRLRPYCAARRSAQCSLRPRPCPIAQGAASLADIAVSAGSMPPLRGDTTRILMPYFKGIGHASLRRGATSRSCRRGEIASPHCAEAQLPYLTECERVQFHAPITGTRPERL